MFTTLHYSKEEDEIVCVSRTNRPPLPRQSYQHSACHACRDKKLKCTGQKTGCDRCRVKSIACEYTSALDECKKKRKRASTQSLRRSSPPTTPTSKTLSTGRSSVIAPWSINAKAESSKQGPALSTKSPSPVDVSDDVFDTGSEMTHSTGPSTTSTPIGSWREDFAMPSIDDFAGLEMEGLPTPPLMSMADFNIEDMFDFPMDLLQMPTPDTSFSTDNVPIVQNLTFATDIDMYLPMEDNIAKMLSPNAGSRPSLNPHSKRDESPTSSTTSRTHSYHSNSADSGYSSPSHRCRCNDLALQMLESLQIRQKCDPSFATEQQLYFIKRVLNQCDTIVKCTSCSQVSSLMLLVGIICENLMSVFETVESDWEGQHGPEDGHTADHKEDNSPQKHNGGSNNNNAFFDSYQVDTMEERSGLVGCLILLQLNRLASTLTHLRQHAMSGGWESHPTILQPIHQRLQAMKDRL